MSDPNHTHGLAYPPDFLLALPVLQPRPAPHQPIRALSAPHFARIHLDYLTAHAPDHVLFPFLHGLEGDNEAQNAFFAAARSPGAIPRFRGLVWVACDDSDEDTDEYDDDDDEEELEDDDCSSASSLESLGTMDIDSDVPMDLDPSISGPEVPGCPPPSPPLRSKTPPPSHLDRPPASSAPLPVHNPTHMHAHPPSPPPPLPAPPSVLTSSFRPRELLQLRAHEDGSASCVFVEPRVPDGISLRNFGIQVPIYATLSDIVVYSPKGNTRAALALAEKFKNAVEAKHTERSVRCPQAAPALVAYNVFVLDASPAELTSALPHLLVRVEDASRAHTDGTDAHAHGDSDGATGPRANTVDFARREKEEMRDLTQASEIVSVAGPSVATDDLYLDALSGSTTAARWEPALGQVFLGNSSDVPLPPDRRIRMRPPPARAYPSPSSSYTEEDDEDDDSVFDWRTNDPARALGFDVCIECHDYAPFPTAAHIRAAEEHYAALEHRWVERCIADVDWDAHPGDEASKVTVPPRPPPNAAGVIHLPFPSSPPSSMGTVNALLPFIAFVERLLHPPEALTLADARAQLAPRVPASAPASVSAFGERRGSASGAGFGPSSLPPPSAFPASFFPPSPPSPQSAYTRVRSTSASYVPSPPSSSSPPSPPSSASSAIATSPSLSHAKPQPDPQPPLRTRPAKVLIYSADGYTESSVLALCLLMALRGLALPEAYLALQVEKRRSFFVYPADVGVLRRVEARLERDRAARGQVVGRDGGRVLGEALSESPVESSSEGEIESQIKLEWARPAGKPAVKSVSFTAPPAAGYHLRSQSESDPETLHLDTSVAETLQAPTGRPRASTLPLPLAGLPSLNDHQVWFNDPRFDGSFPSRVLPFLYLGNLNHASNAYMLHALGITHVVSVGECALVPPPHIEASVSAPSCASPGPGAHFVPGKGPDGQGSLWIEEREGRIKVLDIKGVCDDGIDTLEPQLEPICEWIDRAREDGGKVLVHCRVGVSRSATVTIAYVMKHLGLPLVDAYLIVRSRRLSVLIQPNMRLLYNLLGWEVKLARERSGGDEQKLKSELARSLNWPYLAKEVHALNEKYLH
ncbi:hypothetical protein AcV5_008226 [Taiwanofungus camphoratus]|nr:hypothetical protein AcV5_008226 [Antrodia cinnamomea]